MSRVHFDSAYYIKLGRTGKWEESSISEGKLRIGWGQQTTDDINQGRWEVIRKQLERHFTDEGAVTRDLNALQLICKSTKEDVWITFYSSKLWWCRVGNHRIYEDNVSKYRKLSQAWSDRDIHGNVLLINRISGRLSKIQGFRGTACRVKETEDLRRLINDEPSDEFSAINDSKKKLIENVEQGIKRLHWKDFETFIDLLFRQSGWRRLTMVGETMKYVDLELEDPITRDQYQVQVKSHATVADFKEYADQFSAADYRKLYFVVHTPDSKLLRYNPEKANVELLLPSRLAEMAVDLGLVNWLMSKIR